MAMLHLPIFTVSETLNDVIASTSPKMCQILRPLLILNFIDSPQYRVYTVVQVVYKCKKTARMDGLMNLVAGERIALSSFGLWDRCWNYSSPPRDVLKSFRGRTGELGVSPILGGKEKSPACAGDTTRNCKGNLTHYTGNVNRLILPLY